MNGIGELVNFADGWRASCDEPFRRFHHFMTTNVNLRTRFTPHLAANRLHPVYNDRSLMLARVKTAKASPARGNVPVPGRMFRQRRHNGWRNAISRMDRHPSPPACSAHRENNVAYLRIDLSFPFGTGENAIMADRGLQIVAFEMRPQT